MKRIIVFLLAAMVLLAACSHPSATKEQETAPTSVPTPSIEPLWGTPKVKGKVTIEEDYPIYCKVIIKVEKADYLGRDPYGQDEWRIRETSVSPKFLQVKNLVVYLPLNDTLTVEPYNDDMFHPTIKWSPYTTMGAVLEPAPVEWEYGNFQNKFVWGFSDGELWFHFDGLDGTKAEELREQVLKCLLPPQNQNH